MIDARFQRVCAIIQQVIDTAPEDQEFFIREVCGDDPGLASEVLAAFNPDPSIAAMLEFHDVRPVEDPLIGKRVKDFQIESLIGSGGMGIIYKAVQISTGKTVALKFIHLHQISSPFGTAGRIRFENEIKTLAKLDHPNIAKILTAEITETPEGSRPFFAMELVDGRPVDQFITESKAPILSIVQLIAEIAEAIAHAHARGCIHRDIKPQNILVDSEGRPKIIDFGIAKAIDPLGVAQSRATMTGQSSFPIGTLTYMSPEQGNKPTTADIPTDVYSLGVIAYELLARRRPLDFTNLSLGEALRMLEEKDPPPLRSLVPNIDLDIETVIAKAMEKDPVNRYPDAAHLAADLRRILNHEPIKARPPTAAYVFGKFIRRNPGLAGGVAIAVLSLAVGTGFATLGMLRAKQRAEQNKELRWATFDAVGQLAQLAIDPLQPMPGEGDADLTAEQNIKVARVRVESLLQTVKTQKLHPEAEAAILHVIGEQYLSLGETEKAESMYQAVIQVHSHEHGVQHPDVAAANASLAYLRLGEWRLDESALLLESAIATLLSQESDRWQIEAAGAIDNLARVRQAQGRLSESNGLFQQELSIRRRLQGANDINTAQAEHNLAFLLIDSGKSADAEPILRRILIAFERTMGVNSREVAITLRSLGISLREQSKLTEAESVLQRAIPIDIKVSGEGSELGAILRMHLGASMIDQLEQLSQSGTADDVRLQEAEKLLRTAFTTLNTSSKLSAAVRAESRAERARVLFHAGKLDEARVLLKEAQAIATEIPEVVRIQHRVRVAMAEIERVQRSLAK